MAKSPALLAFLLAATTAAGAHESKHIHETVDPYTSIKTLTLEVDTRGCPGDPSPGPYSAQVHLLISATQYAAHDVGYTLLTDMDHSDLKPPKDAVMDTLIDGLPAQLAIAGPRSKWREHNVFHHGHHNREVIPYEVSLDYLSSMADARLFEFRVNGRTRGVQRCSTAKQLRDLHEFLNAAAAY